MSTPATSAPSIKTSEQATNYESLSEGDLSAALDQLLDAYPATANQIIDEIFPAKVIHLTELAKKYSSLTVPAPVFTDIGAELNTGVVDLITVLKVEINEMLSYLDPVRVWVQLNIPRMTDQKGSSVQTKEDIVEMLNSGRTSGQTVLDGISRYFSTRGKLISKKLKFGNVADWQINIAELDRKEYSNLRSMLVDLRNNYAILFDFIVKNREKLKQEKHGSSYEHMY